MSVLSRLLGAIEPRTARSLPQAATYALWPLAVLIVLQRLWWALSEPFPSGRFLTVYDASFAFINPHLAEHSDPAALSPGAAMLTAPLAVMTPETAWWWWQGCSVAALLTAWCLVLRVLHLPMRSPATPVLLGGMFLCGPVTSTLLTADLGAFVLLALTLWLLLAVRHREVVAAITLGAVVALMPVFAALLIVPLLRRRWVQPLLAAAVATAIAVPVWIRTGEFGFSALDSTPGSSRSVFAVADYLHLPTVVAILLAATIVAGAVAALVLLYLRREEQPLTVLTASGIVLLASCLLTPIATAAYSLTLVPLVASVVLAGSVLRSWPAWLAVYAFGTDENWSSAHFFAFGTHLEMLRPTLGWMLLLATSLTMLATGHRTPVGPIPDRTMKTSPLEWDSSGGDSAPWSGGLRIGSAVHVAINESR